MDGTLLWSAGLAGMAVVTVTWLAGRLGGTMGGLLSTAPITSTAALIFLSLEAGNATVGNGMLAGGRALFAALLAMPAYFYGLKATRGAPLTLRLTLAISTFVLTFTAGTLALHRLTPDAWGAIWLPASLIFSGILAMTFLNARLPALSKRPAALQVSKRAMLARFLSGAGVVVAVAFLREAMPGLGAAWAIFPGTFLVTLWVLGRSKGAAFSAKAAQGGVLGIPPMVAYLLTLWAVLPLYPGAAWAFLAQVPAWCAYFAIVLPLARWQDRTPAPRGTAA